VRTRQGSAGAAATEPNGASRQDCLKVAMMVEANERKNMNSSPSTTPSGLLLRIHLSDGTVESFVPTDKAKAQQICQDMELARLFSQQRLVIAGIHSKSVFVCSEVVRVDFVGFPHASWPFPESYFDMVELSEKDFQKAARLDQPELMPKREQPTPVGDPLVSFLKLHFRNAVPVFLMVEFAVKLPAENQSFMRFLLSKTALPMRLVGGGVGAVNLAHLAGYTVYPGVAQIPGDSWLAEPARLQVERHAKSPRVT
jgi:hypothetical protein